LILNGIKNREREREREREMPFSKLLFLQVRRLAIKNITRRGEKAPTQLLSREEIE
jgi:hypothetical protein